MVMLVPTYITQGSCVTVIYRGTMNLNPTAIFCLLEVVSLSPFSHSESEDDYSAYLMVIVILNMQY